MKSHYIEVNGNKWYVESHGVGKPILCLHGFTGSSSSWADITTQLSAHHQVIAIDFIGHGQSDAPEDAASYTMKQTVDAIRHIMREVTDSRFVCLGYSMGGRVALSLAAHHPDEVTGLILESTSPGLQSEVERTARIQNDERLAEKILEFGVEQFVSEWERIPMFASQSSLPSGVLERQRKIRMGQDGVGLAASLRGLGTGAQSPVWDQLSNVNMPTLVVTGQLDIKFCRIASLMMESLPNAKHVVVPGAGHTVHLEQPKTYLEQIEAFLRQMNG